MTDSPQESPTGPDRCHLPPDWSLRNPPGRCGVIRGTPKKNHVRYGVICAQPVHRDRSLTGTGGETGLGFSEVSEMTDSDEEDVCRQEGVR